MIERFNFYDIYGYLIPGLAVILFFSVPLLVSTGAAPSADLAGAVAALAAAYVVGHVLQIVAAKIIPTTQVSAKGAVPRKPSDLLLDPAFSRALQQETRDSLRRRVQERFGIDISNAASRDAAFIQCRNLLSASERRSYAEQFQGMYAMMRGLCAAASLGTLFTAGWVVGASNKASGADEVSLGLWSGGVALVSVAVIALSFQHSLPEKGLRSVVAAALLAVAIFAGGLAFAPSNVRGLQTISAATLLTLLIALWTFGAYRQFTEQWVKTVYYDFLALDIELAKKEK